GASNYTQWWMKRLLFYLAFAVSPVFAQAPGGALRGVVTAPDGLPVPLASIQVRNSQSGKVWTAVASTSGEYAVSGLPPGSYDVSAATIRYLAPFEKKGVNLSAAK